MKKLPLTLKSASVVLAAWFLCLLSPVSHGGLVGEWMLGKWIADSTATMAVHGDMKVKTDRIFWVRHGWMKYKVLSETEIDILVELERPVDGAKFVRFGFHPETGTYTNTLKMTEYSTADRAASGDDASAQGYYRVSH